MAQYLVKDRVSGTETEIFFETGTTVAEAIDAILSTLGLPRRTPDGATLEYSLGREGSGEPLPAGDVVEGRVTAGSDALEITSPSASVVWERVQDLVAGINSEFEGGARDLAAAARDEVRTSIDELKSLPGQQIRSLIMEATERLNVEVDRRVRGIGRDLSFRAQRRIKQRIRKIAATGAFPVDTSTLASAAGNLATVARSALVVPLAASVGVALTTATAAIGLATTATATAEAAADAAMVARAEADSATAAALRAEASAAIAIADAATAQLAADSAARDAATAEAAASGAALDAATAQQTADEHEARPAGVHDDPIRRLASLQVDAQLSTTYELEVDEPRLVQLGDSLWQIASLSLQGENGYDHGCGGPLGTPTNSQIAEYAAQLWIANVGVIGADPSVIETGEVLQLVCPAFIE